jgi:hypothetical protein
VLFLAVCKLGLAINEEYVALSALVLRGPLPRVDRHLLQVHADVEDALLDLGFLLFFALLLLDNGELLLGDFVFFRLTMLLEELFAHEAQGAGLALEIGDGEVHYHLWLWRRRRHTRCCLLFLFLLVLKGLDRCDHLVLLAFALTLFLPWFAFSRNLLFLFFGRRWLWLTIWASGALRFCFLQELLELDYAGDQPFVFIFSKLPRPDFLRQGLAKSLDLVVQCSLVLKERGLLSLRLTEHQSHWVREHLRPAASSAQQATA